MIVTVVSDEWCNVMKWSSEVGNIWVVYFGEWFVLMHALIHVCCASMWVVCVGYIYICHVRVWTNEVCTSIGKCIKWMQIVIVYSAMGCSK